VFDKQCVALTKKEKMRVLIKAPMNPSQVLFGDNAVSGLLMNFLPTNNPQKYAMMSLQMINEQGNNNL
jgi:hypothetical protein